MLSNLDIDSAGSGGEYAGVVLWVANAYGGVLDTPKFPNITADAVSSEHNSDNSRSSATTSVVFTTISVIRSGCQRGGVVVRLRWQEGAKVQRTKQGRITQPHRGHCKIVQFCCNLGVDV